MLDRKVNEFQLALKKFITRLLILAAIVVFGAIAIAQAPRGDASDQENRVPNTLVASGTPLPSPQLDAHVSTASHETSQAQPVAHTQDAFSDVTASDVSTDDISADGVTPVESQPIPDASPIGLEDMVVDDDVQLADSVEDTTYEDIALPEAIGSGGVENAESDDSYSDDHDSYESVPDLLEETPAAEPRTNPYRTQSATEPSEYGDSPLPPSDDLYSDELETDLPAADIDLPVDDTDLGPVDNDFATQGGNSFGIDEISPDAQHADDSAAADPGSLSIPGDGQSEINYQDPPAYSGNNDLRQQNVNGGQERMVNAFDAENASNRFSRTEELGGNPLPRSYAIARRSRSRRTTGGRPGPQNLEGPQTPSLTVEKIAPTEIQVGKPARFQIKVRNVGQVPAGNVIIRDEIPEGTEFINSVPEAQFDDGTDTAMWWDVGTINPGDETVVTMELQPTDEGQVGSVATVSFEASATARARSTKPMLTIEHTGPKKVLVGEPVRFAIKVSNPGSGTATKVVLDEDVPHGLTHSSGPKLEHEVGMILPGQTRHLELTLTASQPGPVTNVLVARGDAGLLAKDTLELEVVAPELQVDIQGPKRRYLEREATFTVSVANPGTATAKSVELVAQLPRGLKFLSTNNSGHYDQSRHAVIWNLEQLPAGEMGKAQFKAVPNEMGDFNIRAEARADRNLASEEQHQLRVEGIAALYYGVADKIDPVEVGGETTYVITVENQGSKTATNIRFRAEVPGGMQPINGTGATQSVINGQIVDFEPIVKLPPKAKTSFEVVVRGTKAGDQKLRVQMISDEIRTPVIKEESTRVYTD